MHLQEDGTYKCECGKVFLTKRALSSHARFCDKYIKETKKISKYLQEDGTYKCECGKIFNNYQSLNGHFSHCKIHRNFVGKGDIPIKCCGKNFRDYSKDELIKISERGAKTIREKFIQVTDHFNINTWTDQEQMINYMMENNVVAFPGIFKGALAVRASDINEEMKRAAAYAIAGVVPEDKLCADFILPNAFDKNIATVVAEAVAEAAVKSGVARITK